MIQNKNENFRDFRVFDFALYPKSKTRKSRKKKLFNYFKLYLMLLHYLFSNKNQPVNIITNKKKIKNLEKKN